MSMLQVSVQLNGRTVKETVDTRTLLLDFIRDHAALTGAKRGCNEGKCGTCTVIMNGKTVKSCNVLAAQADSAVVETVESLADGDKLHPIQVSFHEHHGLQCGFCTAGFLMTTKHLYDSGFPADAQAVREALHGNICRCTGYQKIVESVLSVLRERETRRSGKASGDNLKEPT